MADEYTPTNDEARIGYAQANHDLLDERLAQFDRWLAQHDREVARAVRGPVKPMVVDGAVVNGDHVKGANAEDCAICSSRDDLSWPFVCDGGEGS